MSEELKLKRISSEASRAASVAAKVYARKIADIVAGEMPGESRGSILQATFNFLVLQAISAAYKMAAEDFTDPMELFAHTCSGIASGTAMAMRLDLLNEEASAIARSLFNDAFAVGEKLVADIQKSRGYDA